MKSDSKAQEREETCGNLNQPRPQPCGMWSHAQLSQRPWLWRPRWKFQWIFNMTPLYTLLPEFIENFLSCSQTEWHAHMQTLPKTLPKLQSLWHRHGKWGTFQCASSLQTSQLCTGWISRTQFTKLCFLHFIVKRVTPPFKSNIWQDKVVLKEIQILFLWCTLVDSKAALMRATTATPRH